MKYCGFCACDATDFRRCIVDSGKRSFNAEVKLYQYELTNVACHSDEESHLGKSDMIIIASSVCFARVIRHSIILLYLLILLKLLGLL